MAEQTVKKSTRKSTVPSDETPIDRFRRLAKSRSEKLTHNIKLVRRLCDSYAYKVDPEFAETVLETLKSEFEGMISQWEDKIAAARKSNAPSEEISAAETDVESVEPAADEDSSESEEAATVSSIAE